MLSITLLTHKKVFPNSPFNKQSLTVSGVDYSSTLQTVMDNLNQSRNSESQINKLYNQYGQEIPNRLWKIQIKENMTFYID